MTKRIVGDNVHVNGRKVLTSDIRRAVVAYMTTPANVDDDAAFIEFISTMAKLFGVGFAYTGVFGDNTDINRQGEQSCPCHKFTNRQALCLQCDDANGIEHI
jgi:hypothetical protein